MGPAPAIVSTGADGTLSHSRNGPIEVKLGMWWTGARTVRPGRHLLEGKGFYATTGDADRFGQASYALAEETTGLSGAREVLFLSDGAGWFADPPSGPIAPPPTKP